MAPGEDIWKRLAECGLVTPGQAATIRTEFEHEGPGNDDSPTDLAVLAWLARGKRISDYQRRVLASGLTGPFQFGEYQVHAREESGPLAGTFRARHSPTGHPVRLFFQGGDSADDAAAWKTALSVTRAWQPIQHPLVWRVFETATESDYRFVVTTLGVGKTMQEKIPRKGRLPWPQAVQAMEQLAHGLRAIHQAGQVHGKLSPDFVWIQKSGVCQIIPPVPWTALPVENGDRDPDDSSNGATDPARRFMPPGLRRGRDRAAAATDDLFALGQIGIRILAGRVKTMRAEDYDERMTELQELDKFTISNRVYHFHSIK